MFFPAAHGLYKTEVEKIMLRDSSIIVFVNRKVCQKMEKDTERLKIRDMHLLWMLNKDTINPSFFKQHLEHSLVNAHKVSWGEVIHNKVTGNGL
jgi:hypothetical protein